MARGRTYEQPDERRRTNRSGMYLDTTNTCRNEITEKGYRRITEGKQYPRADRHVESRDLNPDGDQDKARADSKNNDENALMSGDENQGVQTVSLNDGG
ncbi:hypothetical protein R1flu_016478 [Riccia fluitans]|uniref:Uncharacterized protein n=1 Tax=Riccia fluitans TaxID=41844 RepID=A0ABD1YQU9_9MARC